MEKCMKRERQHSQNERHGVVCLPLLAAQVCEQLEQLDDALQYAAVALRFVTDPIAAADMRPTTHVQAYALQGRVMASKGAMEDAERAFTSAISCAHSHGLRLLEMFALRDLKKCVLDDDGRGEDGARRLRSVLKEMKAPAEDLTRLLGDGLDAAVILAS